MNKGSHQRRLQRVEACALQASTTPCEIRIVFFHARDGRPAGISVWGPDGHLVWLEPPEGCREGELAGEEEQPAQNRMAA